MQKLLEDAKEGVEVRDAKGRNGTPKCSMHIRMGGKGTMARLCYVLRWDETFRKTVGEQPQLVEKKTFRQSQLRDAH